MKAELEIKLLLNPINEYRIPEPQPCGVQVVEWVGLVRANELVEKLKTLIYKTLPLFS